MTPIKYWADIIETLNLIIPKVSSDFKLINNLPARNRLLLNVQACRNIAQMCRTNVSTWNMILDVLEASSIKDVNNINKAMLNAIFRSKDFGNNLVTQTLNTIFCIGPHNSLWFSAYAQAQTIYDVTDFHSLWFSAYTQAQTIYDNTDFHSTIAPTLNAVLKHQNEYLFPLFAPIKGWENSWRTINTIEITKSIYHDKAFDRLPILADALMDEGCEHEEVMAVLKSGSPYFCRGMWILEQLNEIN